MIWRSDAYKAFIREHDCLKCGSSGSQAHHESFGRGGMGVKAPDSHCVPLCPRCHIQRHNDGPITFWQTVDVKLKMVEMLTAFIERIEAREYVA